MNAAFSTVAAVLAAASLRAQTPTPTPSPSPEPQPSPPAVVAGAGPDGFLLQSGDGDYRLLFRAYTHADVRLYPGDEEELGTDQFLLRRVRPILQGTVAKHFDFNVTPDFGGGAVTLQDAYLDVRYTPKARFRFGKTKVPLNFERLQSATAITFAERSLVSALVPNRDVGIGVYGDLAGGVFTYVLGAYGGAVDGGSADLDTNDGKDLVTRLIVSPFKKGPSILKDLGFGIAGSIGDQEGPLPTYRSGGQLTIATYVSGATADGRRTRLVPQLSLYSGRVGLTAEYARSDAFVKSPSGTRTEVGVRAWQATAGVTLTGEAASFTALRPGQSFDPGQGRWGAFELGARVNGFEIEDDAFTAGLLDPARSVREAFAWGAVLNWYLNRHVKQVVSYERTTFTGGAAGGADRPSENALIFRTQLSF